MGDLFWIVVVAGMTLLASFLCSLFEAALYSITPPQVELLRTSGRKGSGRLADLRADVEKPIAAILTVNTIAHTVGAAWCGAMVGDYYGSEAVGLFAAIFTVLVLALTEIVPKSIGVRYAVLLGPMVAWPIQVMIWSVWPVVWVAQKAMHKLTGGQGPLGPSEDEVMIVAGLAAKGGLVRGEEQRWVENALRLDQVTAGDLRTPRTVVESLPADTSLNELVRNPDRIVHSRLPVTEGGNPDKMVGLVYRRDVFDAALGKPEEDLILADLMRPLRFVPEGMAAHELLSLFLREREHMVAVIDEYGGLEGVVSLEDVLECMLGKQIVDEHDRHTDLQALALERSKARRASVQKKEGPPESPPEES